jgi:hypothetical protein
MIYILGGCIVDGALMDFRLALRSNTRTAAIAAS